MLSSEFNWDKYLKTCEAKAAPENLFKPVSLPFKANVAVSFNVSQMLKSLLRNDDAEPEWNRFPHPPLPWTRISIFSPRYRWYLFVLVDEVKHSESEVSYWREHNTFTG